jgi:hypothetical protein
MKVFCVGLSKTGTTSLTRALRLLGLDAVHWYATRDAFVYDGDRLRIDWDLFERHDAFADTPIARIYPELDARYPGARFILTGRDTAAWLRSFADQFAAGGLDPFSARLHLELYGTDTFDADRCRAAFEGHRARVRSHFAGRPDALLEMDIGAGDGWGPLCEFLGRPRTDIPFPHRFRRAERRDTLGWRLARALGRRLGVAGPGD